MSPKFIAIFSTGLLLAANAAAQDDAAMQAAPEAAPAEAAPVEAAPVEAAPVEAAPVEAAPVEAAPAPAAEAAPAPAPAEESKADEEGNMGGILIGLKLGMLLTGSMDFKIDNPSAGAPGQPAKISQPIASRSDFQLTVPLNFGGSGFGFDLQPSLTLGDVTAVGLYLGPAYHLEITPKVYVNFGLGPQVRYWLEDTVDLGADVFARVPVGATYYAMPDLGLFAELGLAYGASAYKGKEYTNPLTGTTTKPDVGFGTGFAVDFGVGIRYP